MTGVEPGLENGPQAVPNVGFGIFASISSKLRLTNPTIC
jgi:hypothetical protein